MTHRHARFRARSRLLLRAAFAAAVGLAAVSAARAEQVGEVDTVFKLIGPDHKIVVDAYDDPGVAGVTCYVARAKTGGLKGAVGLAEDTSDASLACRQIGPILFPKPLPKQEEVFSERPERAVQEAARRAHGRCFAQHADLPDLLRARHRRLAQEQRDRGGRRPGDEYSHALAATPPGRRAPLHGAVPQAAGAKKKGLTNQALFRYWRSGRDSNPRPPA